jgi:hypothetical protein
LGFYDPNSNYSSEHSGEDSNDSEQMETEVFSYFMKPALGRHWSEIIDQRLALTLDFMVDLNDPEGVIYLKRQISLLHSRDSQLSNPIKYEITEGGIEC